MVKLLFSRSTIGSLLEEKILNIFFIRTASSGGIMSKGVLPSSSSAEYPSMSSIFPPIKVYLPCESISQMKSPELNAISSNLRSSAFNSASIFFLSVTSLKIALVETNFPFSNLPFMLPSTYISRPSFVIKTASILSKDFPLLISSIIFLQCAI